VFWFRRKPSGKRRHPDNLRKKRNESSSYTLAIDPGETSGTAIVDRDELDDFIDAVRKA
jgi:hypothetical protein